MPSLYHYGILVACDRGLARDEQDLRHTKDEIQRDIDNESNKVGIPMKCWTVDILILLED